MGFYSEYLYENCITWTTDGANAGCVKYRAGKFYCTNVCGVLLEKAKQPDYFIAEVINRISKKYVSYVGNPKLMNNVMAEISIDIPSSDESRFLSNVVKVIINRIKSEEDVLTKLETYKSGLLQTIFI